MSVYAPQVGCTEQEKDEFWELLDEAVGKIPCNERVWIGGDLNGHVGEGNTGEVFVGRFGLGVRNAEGNRIVEFAQRMEMAIVNTFFEKRKEHKITYKSGGRESQIDYMLCRRRHLKAVMDYKVFPGESVTSQHRAVVCKIGLEKTVKRVEKREPRIKWWKLKNKDFRDRFTKEVAQKLGEELPLDWKTTADGIRKIGEQVLGRTLGKRKEGKENWWWEDKVQEALRIKKASFRRWSTQRDEQSRMAYKDAKRELRRWWQKQGRRDIRSCMMIC